MFIRQNVLARKNCALVKLLSACIFSAVYKKKNTKNEGHTTDYHILIDVFFYCCQTRDHQEL